VLLAKTLRSSTFKLALICIGIFGSGFLALFAYVYWSTATYVRERTDAGIAAEQAILGKVYARAGRAGLIAAIDDRIANDDSENAVVLLTDPSYARVAGNLDAWPAKLRGATGWHDFEASVWKSSAVEPPTVRATLQTLPDGYRLLVGKEVDDFDELIDKIRTAALAGVALLFVIAAVAGIAVTRRTVGRIESINATSQSIMQSGLGERIPLRGTRDEWDQVAANLNSMLDRVEALMGEVKQVSDNVAHDLRTPLTRMRGRLEKAAARTREAEQDQALIADTLADLDAVLRMFASLTRISQIEAGDRMSAFRTVDLAEIASEVVELFDAAAEDKRSQLDAIGDARVLVTGDRDLLFDAVANLVDNAIKYGREAGRVTVEVTRDHGNAVVSVADDGPGIPADEQQQVFKRFYRLERSRHTPGNGLGLSLVAAVARLHGATIEMLDNKPGLRCRLHFPAPMA
jgi:signal transduction histidine kinase